MLVQQELKYSCQASQCTIWRRTKQENQPYNIIKFPPQMAPGSCHRVCILGHHIILDCPHRLWHLVIAFHLPLQYALSAAHHTSHHG